MDVRGEYFDEKTLEGLEKLDRTIQKAKNGDLHSNIQLGKYYFRIHKYKESKDYFYSALGDTKLTNKERTNISEILREIKKKLDAKKYDGLHEVMRQHPTPYASSRRNGKVNGTFWKP